MYQLIIDTKVIKDLKKIDAKWQRIILEKLHITLTTNPHMGKKLVGIWSKYHRLRVGDYRIIYEIREIKVIVEVIMIKHRKEAYK